MTNCECQPDAGEAQFFCKRHGVYKPAKWLELCQTVPVLFDAWEAGEGPRQSRPATPSRPPRKNRTPCGKSQPAQGENEPWRSNSTGGPGTELKAILTRFGIKPKGCGCNSYAAQMDRRGPAWCRDNLDKITEWLLREGKKRNLPLAKFSRPAVKVLIRWAIRRAERQCLSKGQNKW